MTYKPVLITLSLGIILAGCLKNEGVNYANQATPAPNIVGFTPLSSPTFDVFVLNVSTTPIPYNYYVELSSANNTFPQATVTVAKNASSVDDYNTANGTNYEMLPDSTYQLANTSASFDPKTHLATIAANINSSKIDLSHTYALGLAIQSISTSGVAIAQNNITKVVAISVKNIYDGAYSLTIKTVGWGTYGIANGTTGTYPGDYLLITKSANTVSGFSAFRGDGLQPAFTSGGTPTAFGATTPLFTFDNANKLIAVTNTTAPDSRNRQLAINPAVTNSRFDPTTQTIYAAFLMTQNGRPTQYIYDTLIYQHSR
jgi:hypothetical protein